MILDEPTRGIDVGAKAEIEKLIGELRRDGMAILFISSELEEVVRVSHRVAVLRDHAKIGELSGEQIDVQHIMRTIARADAMTQTTTNDAPAAPDTATRRVARTSHRGVSPGQNSHSRCSRSRCSSCSIGFSHPGFFPSPFVTENFTEA